MNDQFSHQRASIGATHRLADVSDDRNWLAFRYVADELSEVEREAFESQLAHDQAAREAVAAAVELAQAVMLVEEMPQPKPVRAASWSLAATWMSLGASLCVAVWSGVAYLAARHDPGQVETVGADSPEVLASLWSETRQARVERNAGAWTPGEVESPAMTDVESDMDANVALESVTSRDFPIDETGLEPTRGTPSWMIVAVRATADQAENDAANREPSESSPAPSNKVEEL